MIQKLLLDWQNSNPEGRYEDAIDHTQKIIMSMGKGEYTPHFIETLIKMEKSVWENKNYNVSL
jgi:hypothetical protein